MLSLTFFKYQHVCTAVGVFTYEGLELCETQTLEHEGEGGVVREMRGRWLQSGVKAICPHFVVCSLILSCRSLVVDHFGLRLLRDS